ncbi:CinA family protein [Foetidibacter luteolus]|uniref:CinA family protein n=1 Tax=Foetidibacter luteolus TaxID=2608880 RepID=UPI00129C0E32|nr:CinA family protein [Foetidibacter luteolus]
MIEFDKANLNIIRAALKEREETIAVAESVTGGLLQAAFALTEEASLFFQGGITVYNLAQKYHHLQVEPVHALKVNCVSSRVADEMALNVCRLFNSHWGLSVTGYSSPVPESNNEIFAYFSIAGKGAIQHSAKITPPKNTPENLHLLYVNEIIQRAAMLIIAG